MKEDINKLEIKILETKGSAFPTYWTKEDATLVENLIKGYKELEECLEVVSKALGNIAYDQIPIAITEMKEKIKELEEKLKIVDIMCLVEKDKYEIIRKKDYIEKSKVREKIEEAKERIEDICNQEYVTADEDEEMYILETKIAGWKELLQEGDK